MENKRGRGRPPTFSREDRQYLAELNHQHGIAGARRHQKNPPFAGKQLTMIARDFSMVLQKRRRPKSAA